MIISEEEADQPPSKKAKLLPPPQQPPSPFYSLPNEIALDCFARLPKLHYPSLSLVSKTFHSLLTSWELYAARSQIGTTETSLYICLKLTTTLFTGRQWFSLLVKPKPYLSDGRIQERSSGNRFVPCPNSPPPHPPPPYSESTVTIGSKVYFFGTYDLQPTSIVRVYECRNKTWRDLPNMKMKRTHASACVLDGKIYVMGGCLAFQEDTSWSERFDLKSQTWETLPANPDVRVRNGIITVRKIGGVEGKIFVKTGNGLDDWVYDVKERKWSAADADLDGCWSDSWCVVENVMYSYSIDTARYMWYDLEGGKWREVKGLEILRKYRSMSYAFPYGLVELVNYGGKLGIIWDRFEHRGRSRNKNIWCAVVAVERCPGPGGVVVGRIEWFDVVLTVPKSYIFMRSLAITV